MNDNILHRIESLLAHQEKQINDLSDMVILQGKKIDSLRLRLDATQGKLAKIEASASDPDGTLSVTEQALRDKPPHY